LGHARRLSGKVYNDSLLSPFEFDSIVRDLLSFLELLFIFGEILILTLLILDNLLRQRYRSDELFLQFLNSPINWDSPLIKDTLCTNLPNTKPYVDTNLTLFYESISSYYIELSLLYLQGKIGLNFLEPNTQDHSWLATATSLTWGTGLRQLYQRMTNVSLSSKTSSYLFHSVL